MRALLEPRRQVPAMHRRIDVHPMCGRLHSKRQSMPTYVIIRHFSPWPLSHAVPFPLL